MMKKLREFWRLRKRYDSIKFALVLFVCATYFLAHGIVQIVSYANYLGKPTEYILEAYSDSASLEIALQKICEIKGAVSASFQRDYIITTGNDKALAVSELSSEYLSKCYGIQSVENSKKIWLNSIAFDEFIGESENTSVRISYTVDGKQESSEFIRCNELSSDTTLAVSVGTTASLDNSRILRVMFDSIDVTGTDIRYIENLGYTVSNREDILTQYHEQEKILLDMKHCIITTVLSLVSGFAFIKIYKSESSNHARSV